MGPPPHHTPHAPGNGPAGRSRREVVRGLVAGAAALGLGGVARAAQAAEHSVSRLTPSERTSWGRSAVGLAITPEPLFQAHDTFLEYGRDVVAAAKRPHAGRESPWTVEVAGLVRAPGTLTLDELLRLAPVGVHTTRHRAVEGWSAVVPWTGLPLADVVAALEPLPSARYLRLVAHAAPGLMPGMALHPHLPWPYHEALRLDEARHPLAMLAVGAYGRPLSVEGGGPLRLVVPWKYAHKGLKGLVRLEFTDSPPPTFWSTALPHEVDFLGNVRPDVPHRRWSQATERRLVDGVRVPTLPYNGYADQVGCLYR